MQLIQQARLETEKFGVAVQEMAAQVSIKKGQLPVPAMQAKQKLMQRFAVMIGILASMSQSQVTRSSGSEEDLEDLEVDQAVLKKASLLTLCSRHKWSLMMRSKSTNLREPKLPGSGCNNGPPNQDERIARI